ncbi:DUF938 domain-containing protein [Parendozoicomonas sp. Alg238-R29]|uniref:DUF938 domain-containing protein n=1 Tax=Parendozoicomonas sp. Alg238-R29 TaxID=2993446 RepID=UPI00248EC09E|nr:DUF938 domain-containing protein [Parendozoicomonas sp. Alg238-R29]
MDKPFSQACENNKEPILNVLKHHFDNASLVLEIGSGTGQHAVCFSQNLHHLTWQTSDLLENHQGIYRQIADCEQSNLRPPLELNVDNTPWPLTEFDGVFSANTAHIMSWQSVASMFQGIGQYLKSEGVFCLYGPFNYQGNFTSESNARFNDSLQQRAKHMSIRNFEAINQLARKNSMKLIEDNPMPANNRLLVWKKHHTQQHI